MAITQGYRVKLYGASEGLVIAALVTLQHAELGTWRLSTDNADVIDAGPPQIRGTLSRGNSYQWAPISLVLPLDEAESEPAARFSISNVDRRLIHLVRAAADGITATVELIDPADPDNVQRDWPNLQVVSAEYDALEIQLGMRVDILQNEPFPSGRFLPGAFPFLF